MLICFLGCLLCDGCSRSDSPPLICANLSLVDILNAVLRGLSASDPPMEAGWREDGGMEPFHFLRQTQPGDRGGVMVGSLCLPLRHNWAVCHGASDLWRRQEVHCFSQRVIEGHRVVWDAFISPTLVFSRLFLRMMLKC